jgi:predicted transcriptional regulator
MDVLETLKKENEQLRDRVRTLLQKNVKVHQLEMNYQRIQHEYEQMCSTQSRREELMKQYERSMQVPHVALVHIPGAHKSCGRLSSAYVRAHVSQHRSK